MLTLAVDLSGRQVLFVGGGSVAARRVDAFLSQQAEVVIVAPELVEELAARSAEFRWESRAFVPDDLTGAHLVHVATGDGAVDAQITDLCREQGIWCISAGEATRGSVSMPARAELSTPTGPVQVAVTSTDPARSVAVRNSIVAHLHQTPMGFRPRRPHPGWVALVGGGPGDDDLLTKRALALLHSADVVVVDRLAPRGILADLDPEVLVVEVGKTPGHHPVPQDEINRTLVEHALAGRGVVRLKGGDPYVLGRGEEERLACAAAGVPVEVVPGITSAIAVPAAAGIPVTHRGVARAFTVVTGHDAIPALPSTRDHTVVVLMGVNALAQTAAMMISHGRDPRTPVAIIESGCTPQQRVSTGELRHIAEVARERGVRAPAVVIVGDVVRLGPDWRAASPQAI